MTKKAKFIVEELNKLYPEPTIPLKSKNTFTFLIAVLLSAQCTDKRVNEVGKTLFNVASSPEDFLKLSLEDIEELIHSCGLYKNKAKNIKALSEILVNEHNSEVPKTFQELEKLPGVGHKTASVIMMQAFGIPSFPVDTHIHRLATRWKLCSGKNVVDTEYHLKKIFPKTYWYNLHLQFIYYGREFCKAHSCKTPETYCKICKELR